MSPPIFTLGPLSTFDASTCEQGGRDSFRAAGKEADQSGATEWANSGESIRGNDEGAVGSDINPLVECDAQAETAHSEDLSHWLGPDERMLTVKSNTKLVVEFPQSTLTRPRSLYAGFDFPASLILEWRAIQTFLLLSKDHDFDSDDSTEFKLDDFAIYVDSKQYPTELRSLQDLTTRQASDTFYYDGFSAMG